MLRYSLVVLLTIGCTAQKSIPDEDFSDLAQVDQKSDAFSYRLKLLGALNDGDSLDASYSKSPRFRGYTVEGSGPVDVWVRAQTDDGDALTWLLDGHFRVLAKSDDADETTYDSHIEATLEAGKTYYLVFRDYNLTRGHFTVERTGGADPSAAFHCSGTGMIASVPDDCMDDGGGNDVGDSLEIYCMNGRARFCLSGEACIWRTGSRETDDGTTCSRGGIGLDSSEFGGDFMTHAWCSQWRGQEWYYCGPDGQIRFSAGQP